jgi:hypothetical protein
MDVANYSIIAMLRLMQMLHLSRKKLSLNYIFPPYQPTKINGSGAEKSSDENIVEGNLIDEQIMGNSNELVSTNIIHSDNTK